MEDKTKSKKSREEKIGITRILAIDAELRDNTYPNATTLGKMLEVHRATICRDIEFMRDRLKAPIEFDQVRNGYYYTDPTFFIKSILLSEGEIFSLAAIQPLLDQYKNTPLEDTMKQLCKKLISFLPQQISVNSALISKNITLISDHLPSIETKVFGTVFKALQIHRTMEVEYRSATNTDFKIVKIDPLHILCKQGNWYVISFSHEHTEIRTYALARIKNPKISKDSFTIPKDFVPEKYFDSSFGVWNLKDEPKKVEIIFTKELANYISERSWHETQTIEQNKDGTIVLTFSTNQLVLARNWVLSFGSSALVLNPPELVEMVKTEIKNMTTLYQAH